MGDRGGARESAVRSFLSDQLPTRFAISSGEVMDAAGNNSGQTDVVIYDSLNTRPLYVTDGVALLPAETLLATVEIKSTISKTEIEKAVGGMNRLRTLRPWDAPWSAARRDGHPADDGLPRIFTTVFAFATDLAKSNWPTNEMLRLRECCAAAGLPTAYFDRLIVLDRGVLLPSTGTVYAPTNEKGALGSWFFQLVSFLSREAARREQFPWDRYRLDERDSWLRVAEKIDDAPVATRATESDRLKARKDRNEIAFREN